MSVVILGWALVGLLVVRGLFSLEGALSRLIFLLKLGWWLLFWITGGTCGCAVDFTESPVKMNAIMYVCIWWNKILYFKLIRTLLKKIAVFQYNSNLNTLIAADKIVEDMKYIYF